MESLYWKYQRGVGSWAVAFKLDDGACPTDRQGQIKDLVARAARALQVGHRPRIIWMDCVSVDSEGRELDFVERQPTEAASWAAVERVVDSLSGTTSGRTMVESLFVELDVEVDLPNGTSWIERGAELQLGVHELHDPRRAELALTFHTHVDIWVSPELAGGPSGDGSVFRLNEARLRTTLENLVSELGVEFDTIESTPYPGRISARGFSRVQVSRAQSEQ